MFPFYLGYKAYSFIYKAPYIYRKGPRPIVMHLKHARQRGVIALEDIYGLEFLLGELYKRRKNLYIELLLSPFSLEF